MLGLGNKYSELGGGFTGALVLVVLVDQTLGRRFQRKYTIIYGVPHNYLWLVRERLE